MSTNKYFSLFFIVSVGLILASAYKENSNKISIQNLKRKTLSVHIFDDLSSSNPHADLKMFLIKKNSLTQIKEQPINTFADLKKAIYVKYILEDHSGIIECLDNYKLEGHEQEIISELTLLYILPAYLYEREGLSGLSKSDYTRFLHCYKKLSEKNNYFQDINIQNRVSLSRIKRRFLEKTIPKLRHNYYTKSPFSSMIENLNEFQENKCFKNYKYRGYLTHISYSELDSIYEDESELMLDNRNHEKENSNGMCLDSFALFLEDFRVTDAPFEIYELFASLCWCNICLQKTTQQKLLFQIDTIINNTDNQFIKSISLFKKALTYRTIGKTDEASGIFLECQKFKSNDLAFLTDDATLFYYLIKYENNIPRLKIEVENLKKAFGKMGDANLTVFKEKTPHITKKSSYERFDRQ